MLWEEAVAVDDGRGEVDQFAVGGPRLVTQHREGCVLVDRVAFHQDPLCPFDRGAAPERALEVVVLGEATQNDVNRALPILDVGV